MNNIIFATKTYEMRCLLCYVKLAYSTNYFRGINSNFYHLKNRPLPGFEPPTSGLPSYQLSCPAWISGEQFDLIYFQTFFTKIWFLDFAQLVLPCGYDGYFDLPDVLLSCRLGEQCPAAPEAPVGLHLLKDTSSSAPLYEFQSQVS